MHARVQVPEIRDACAETYWYRYSDAFPLFIVNEAQPCVSYRLTYPRRAALISRLYISLRKSEITGFPANGLS